MIRAEGGGIGFWAMVITMILGYMAFWGFILFLAWKLVEWVITK